MNTRRGDEVYGRALAALAGDDAVDRADRARQRRVDAGRSPATRRAPIRSGPSPSSATGRRPTSSSWPSTRRGRPIPPAVALPGPDRAGWLLARAFPDDPRLPGLAAVMAGSGRRTVVRYRPGRRCTIRVEDGGGTRFVKVLKAQADGAAMHRDAVALAAAASAGRLGFAVAAPDRFDPVTSALWQGALPGTPVKPRLLGPGGPALAELMGAALATLHASGVEPSGVAPPRAAFVRARSAAADLTRRLPALQGDAEAVLARIEAVRDAAAARPLRPVHGAPHAGPVARRRRPPRARRLRPLRHSATPRATTRVHVRDGLRGPGAGRDRRALPRGIRGERRPPRSRPARRVRRRRPPGRRPHGAWRARGAPPRRTAPGARWRARPRARRAPR